MTHSAASVPFVCRRSACYTCSTLNTGRLLFVLRCISYSSHFHSFLLSRLAELETMFEKSTLWWGGVYVESHWSYTLMFLLLWYAKPGLGHAVWVHAGPHPDSQIWSLIISSYKNKNGSQNLRTDGNEQKILQSYRSINQLNTLLVCLPQCWLVQVGICQLCFKDEVWCWKNPTTDGETYFLDHNLRVLWSL